MFCSQIYVLVLRLCSVYTQASGPTRETVTVKHMLGLSSAYDYRHDSTTYHKGFKGVVDYLLYTRDSLRLEGVLQLVSPKVFR